MELHPLGGSIVELRRGEVERYVRPYFEARVRALRVIGSADAVTSVVEGRDKEGGVKEALREKDGEEKGRKRKKAKLEWRERWVVVHQGTLSLFKERGVSTLFFFLFVGNFLCHHNVGCERAYSIAYNAIFNL